MIGCPRGQSSRICLAALTAEYFWPMTFRPDAAAFLRWACRSEIHSDVANTPAVRNDGYQQVFLRFAFAGKSWAASLSIDNSFDE